MHGDDFVCQGDVEDLKWLNKEMENRFETKTAIIGSGEGEAREGRILNRVRNQMYR